MKYLKRNVSGKTATRNGKTEQLPPTEIFANMMAFTYFTRNVFLETAALPLRELLKTTLSHTFMLRHII